MSLDEARARKSSDLIASAGISIGLRVVPFALAGAEPARAAEDAARRDPGDRALRDAARSGLVYDLVAVDAHRDAVEPLELVSYDPEAREYVVTSSAGLPVPEAWRAPLEPEVVVRTPPWVVWLAAGLVALLGLGLWQRVRGAASARRGEAGSHAGTWTALLGALEHQQPDVGEHFTAWVGERLGVPPASLVGEDVRAKLEAAGLPSTVAERTAVALNAFVRARYGAPVAPADVLDADLLEAIATATSGHHGPE